ncbi:MAG: hypothetical protein ACP5RP_03580 [Candidatus Micrarchaeia archaeon]
MSRTRKWIHILPSEGQGYQKTLNFAKYDNIMRYTQSGPDPSIEMYNGTDSYFCMPASLPGGSTGSNFSCYYGTNSSINAAVKSPESEFIFGNSNPGYAGMTLYIRKAVNSSYNNLPCSYIYGTTSVPVNGMMQNLSFSLCLSDAYSIPLNFTFDEISPNVTIYETSINISTSPTLAALPSKPTKSI